MKSLKGVVDINRAFFEQTAQEYLEQAELYRDRMLNLFFENFVFRLDPANHLPVIEIGKGAGILAEAVLRSGIQYTAVDHSATMIEIARRYLQRHVPDRLHATEFINRNVFDAGWSHGRRFQALLIQAVIHLFPKPTARTLLKRLSDLVSSHGHVWIATTESSTPAEGYFIDANLRRPSEALRGIASFRAFYTREEFLCLINSAGLDPVRLIDNTDAERDHIRKWMILVCRKRS